MAELRQASSESKHPSPLRRAIKVGRKPLLGLLVIAATLLYLDRVDKEKQLAESAYPTAPVESKTEVNHLDFELSTLDGAAFRPRSLSDKGLSLLLFWQADVPESLSQVAAIEAALTEIDSGEFQLLALASGAPSAELLATAKQRGWRATQVHDPEQQVLRGLLKQPSLPYYVVLDAKGRVLKGKRGYSEKDAKKLGKYLKRRLSRQPKP